MSVIPLGRSVRIVLALFGERARIIEVAISNRRKGGMAYWVGEHLSSPISLDERGNFSQDWYEGWLEILTLGCNLTNSRSHVAVVPVFSEQYAVSGQWQLPSLILPDIPGNVRVFPVMGAGRLVREVGHCLMSQQSVIVAADEMMRGLTVSYCTRLSAGVVDTSPFMSGGGFFIESTVNGLTLVKSGVDPVDLDDSIKELADRARLDRVKGVGVSGGDQTAARENLNGHYGRIYPDLSDRNICSKLANAVFVGAATRAIMGSFSNRQEQKALSIMSMLRS